MKSSYKDKCDICGKFDHLKGKDDKCVCPECLKRLEKESKK